MNFSLDFDGTFTEDPVLWLEWAALALSRGHNVYCVTLRHPHEMEKVHASIGKVIGLDRCIPTGRETKQKFVQDKFGLNIDVWIDDMPHMVIDGGLLFDRVP